VNDGDLLRPRQRDIDARADLYAAGVVLFELLAGRPPFEGDDPFVVASARTLGDPPAPRALNPRLSPQAEEIVLRALRRAPAERYPTAAVMRAELEHPDRVVVSGLSARLRPPTRARRALRLLRYWTLVCVVPLATQVGLFWLLWRHFSRKA